jgi:hypothetical protein
MELFFERLEEIAERPGAFLASPDIFSLKSFIEGWLSSRESIVPIPDSIEHRFIEEFQRAIAISFRCDLSISWCERIFVHSQNAYDALPEALREMIAFRERFLEETSMT